MKLFIMVGTLRCGVPARVQRAEQKALIDHFAKRLRRYTRLGQHSALSLPFFG